MSQPASPSPSTPPQSTPPPSAAPHVGRTRRYRDRLVLMVVVGAVVAGVTSVTVGPRWAASIGWAAACAVYVVTALPLLRADADRTARLASREDPRRTVSDLLLVGAAGASVVALLVVLSIAKGLHGPSQDLAAALGVVSVALSWLLVQTLFTLRYAELWYSGTPGGIDFNQQEPPRYSDFAYFALTVGMTYQVSDTSITESRIRVVTLRHALLSFFFGTVVIASVVNLVAGLGN
ncbi:DUF1345 domain-containing protein [Curtobacterium sp. ER1/6]|uniref:DUF1345 domain-containing protein n=1 Tax=Curtobacterium sp. ER1/6 TaxID=1891920 RepID=UPI000AFC2BD8|nr:DUF1345 domain-containing protein [Curtobacterium sp. ER1/6]